MEESPLIRPVLKEKEVLMLSTGLVVADLIALLRLIVRGTKPIVAAVSGTKKYFPFLASPLKVLKVGSAERGSLLALFKILSVVELNFLLPLIFDYKMKPSSFLSSFTAREASRVLVLMFGIALTLSLDIRASTLSMV